MNEPATTKAHRLRVVVVSLTSVVVGLALLAWSLTMVPDTFWRGLLSNLAQTILVGGVLSLAYEYFLREDVLRMQNDSEARILARYDSIADKFDLAEGCHVVGLHRVHAKEHSIDYSDMLLKSRDLILVFNDGRTWFSSHQADLYERLQRPHGTTTVVVAHPESAFLEALAIKVESTAAHIRTKIQESVTLLSRMKNPEHTLHIYGHFMPSSYSLIMNELGGVFVPYPISRKEDRIPAFEFRPEGDGSFYFLLKRDVDTLIADCARQLYPIASDGTPLRLQVQHLPDAPV